MLFVLIFVYVLLWNFLVKTTEVQYTCGNAKTVNTSLVVFKTDLYQYNHLHLVTKSLLIFKLK